MAVSSDQHQAFFFLNDSKAYQNDPMQHMSCIPTVLGVYNMKVIALFNENSDRGHWYSVQARAAQRALQFTLSRSEKAPHL